MPQLRVDMRIDLAPLRSLQRRSPRAFNTALKRASIQMLNWANLGSAKSPRKPPIRFGVLRASSSAFVGTEFVASYKGTVRGGADERPTPATSIGSARATTVTWAWNTDYATKMHEHTGSWGAFTLQDGNAGRKWLEIHLAADKDSFIDVVRREFQKAAGI
jgi:hypothetical protein